LLLLTKKVFSWNPYKKSGADCDNIIYHNTKHRFRDLDSEDDTSSKPLKNNKGEDLNIPESEVLAGMFSDDERWN
jgi:benzoate 4-monooxygenase